MIPLSLIFFALSSSIVASKPFEVEISVLKKCDDDVPSLSNIKTSNAKQFRNGEICLRASSYLYISVTIFSQFYKEIYNKELDINFFQDAALKIKMLRRRGYFDDPNNMLMYIKDKDNNINVWNFMENFSSEKILNFFEKVNFSSIDNNSLLDDIRNYFVYIRGRYSEMDLEHMKKIEAKLGINK